MTNFKFDFHFILALTVIFSSAAALSLQFHDAGSEYRYLSSSMAPLVRSGHEARGINEVFRLNAELDSLENELELLDLK